VAKPRSKNNYCNVCRQNYEDYLDVNIAKFSILPVYLIRIKSGNPPLITILSIYLKNTKKFAKQIPFLESQFKPLRWMIQMMKLSVFLTRTHIKKLRLKKICKIMIIKIKIQPIPHSSDSIQATERIIYSLKAVKWVSQESLKFLLIKISWTNLLWTIIWMSTFLLILCFPSKVIILYNRFTLSSIWIITVTAWIDWIFLVKLKGRKMFWCRQRRSVHLLYLTVDISW